MGNTNDDGSIQASNEVPGDIRRSRSFRRTAMALERHTLNVVSVPAKRSLIAAGPGCETERHQRRRIRPPVMVYVRHQFLYVCGPTARTESDRFFRPIAQQRAHVIGRSLRRDTRLDQ
jgi:hypothetical protein